MKRKICYLFIGAAMMDAYVAYKHNPEAFE